MKIHLKIDEKEKNIIKSKLYYFTQSLSIQYIAEYYKSFDTAFLLMYDTLTICFNLEGKFVSLDAFAPIETWSKVNSFELPNAIRGTLKIEVFDHEDDRHSFNFLPIYQLSEDGILKILLAETEQGSWLRIGKECFMQIFENKINTIIFTKIYYKDE